MSTQNPVFSCIPKSNTLRKKSEINLFTITPKEVKDLNNENCKTLKKIPGMERSMLVGLQIGIVKMGILSKTTYRFNENPIEILI